MNEIAPLRLAEGIHANIPERDYHADVGIEPSASASILRKLYRQSPEHAREHHPRLNPAWEASKPTDAKDKGTILHSLILRTPAPCVVCTFDSWRGKAADTRDEIRASGKIPILAHKMEEIQETADAINRRIESYFPELHAALGDPDTMTEATIIYRVNGVLCRSRIDVLPPAHYGFIADLKFTGLDAPPDEYERTVRRDYRFQADLYPRGIQATRGDTPEFRFFACEEEPPYGASMHTFGPGAAQRNRVRVDAALAQWAVCLRANEWPGYPSILHTIEDEPWEERVDTDRMMRHAAAAQVTTGTIAQLHRIAAEIGAPLR